MARTNPRKDRIVKPWLLAFALLLGWTAGADAAALALRITVTEVNADDLAVAVGDTFDGVVEPAAEAAPPVLDVASLGLDFGAFKVTDAESTTPVQLYAPAGEVVGLRVDAEVGGVFGFAGPLALQGNFFDPGVAFRDAEGAPIVAGELEVVPVPAALPLLATGLAGLAWLRRRA